MNLKICERAARQKFKPKFKPRQEQFMGPRQYRASDSFARFATLFRNPCSTGKAAPRKMAQTGKIHFTRFEDEEVHCACSFIAPAGSGRMLASHHGGVCRASTASARVQFHCAAGLSRRH